MTSPDQIVAPRRSRVRVKLGAAVVLMLVGLAIAVLVAALGRDGSSEIVDPGGTTGGATSVEMDAGGNPDAPPGAENGSPVGATIFVHLLGAVARPGLYELREGDRAVDVIAAAGGFAANADQAGLNLARVLSDGEQIHVPMVGEVAEPVPGGAGAIVPGKVNLNTADEAGLDTLPGIGPATAKSILDWRETNGRFTAVEDLLSVSGIGNKTFAELKDLVTV